jgi:hypothetical protein
MDGDGLAGEEIACVRASHVQRIAVAVATKMHGNHFEAVNDEPPVTPGGLDKVDNRWTFAGGRSPVSAALCQPANERMAKGGMWARCRSRGDRRGVRSTVSV